MIFERQTAETKHSTTEAEKHNNMFYTLNAIVPNHPTPSGHFIREWFETLRLVKTANSSTTLPSAVENKG
jgi:hypothetical protein